jgi:protocatechuate 3,4-dioxygenase beta subunit
MRWQSTLALLALGLLTFGLPSLLVSAADPDGTMNDTEAKKTEPGEKSAAKEQSELSTFEIAAPADDVPPDTRVAIAGTCVDENNQALAGVEVSLSWMDRIENLGFSRSVAHTQSDNTGRFDFGTLPLVKAREYELQGALAGRGYASADVDISQGDAKGIELTLPQCLPIRGRVFDQAGMPVSGAKVWITGNFSGHGIFALTNAEGEYELSADIQAVTPHNEMPIQYDWRQPRSIRLCAEHPDFVESIVSRPMGTRVVDIRLTVGAAFVGRVVFHETGKPAPDALVEARGRFTNQRETQLADPAGRYRFSKLRPDLYEITLNNYRGGVVREPLEVRVTTGQLQQAPDLLVYPGVLIKGRVLQWPDKPLTFDKSGQATVIAEGPLPSDRRTATIERDGSFQLRVVDGFNRVSIAAEGWQPLRNHVIMAREGENLPLDFRVIPKRTGEQVFLTNADAIFIANVRSNGKKAKSPKLKQSSSTNPDTKGVP